MIILADVTGLPSRSAMVPITYEDPQGLIGDGWYVISAVNGYLERVGLGVGEGPGVGARVRVGASVIVGRTSVGSSVLTMNGVGVSSGGLVGVGVHVAGNREPRVGVAVGTLTWLIRGGPANGPARAGTKNTAL
jgi:hypothetical protein